MREREVKDDSKITSLSNWKNGIATDMMERMGRACLGRKEQKEFRFPVKLKCPLDIQVESLRRHLAIQWNLAGGVYLGSLADRWFLRHRDNQGSE